MNKRLLLAAVFYCLAVSAQLYALQGLHPGMVETLKRGIGLLGAVLWSVWLFKETVTRWQLLCIILLITAIALLIWPF